MKTNLFKGFVGIEGATLQVEGARASITVASLEGDPTPPTVLVLDAGGPLSLAYAKKHPKVITVEEGDPPIIEPSRGAVDVNVIDFVKAWAFVECAEGRKEATVPMVQHIYFSKGKAFCSDGHRLHSSPCGIPKTMPTFRVHGSVLSVFVRAFTLYPAQTTMKVEASKDAVTLFLVGPMSAAVRVPIEAIGNGVPDGIIRIEEETRHIVCHPDHTIRLVTTAEALREAFSRAPQFHYNSPASKKPDAVYLSLRNDGAVFLDGVNRTDGAVPIEGTVEGNASFTQFADEEKVVLNPNYFFPAIPPTGKVVLYMMDPMSAVIMESAQLETSLVMPMKPLKEWSDVTARERREREAREQEFEALP